MGKRVELPLVEPFYSTYHPQGTAGAIIGANPTVRNWFLNEAVNLRCTNWFLRGYTTPDINIVGSSWTEIPHIEDRWISMRFHKGYINAVIREFLDNGYYVYYNGVDDFYVEGKGWYKERHFSHDGTICGYDQENKTYCLYAYDTNWQFNKFWTSQRSFNLGREKSWHTGFFEQYIYGLKVKDDIVAFEPNTALQRIEEYLDVPYEINPTEGDKTVYGIVVQDYIVLYLQRLYDGSIPYERMDRRVFRLIWEHKRGMLERIERIEQALELEPEFSRHYAPLVKQADAMRTLYAIHHRKRRDSVLPAIQKQLAVLSKEEMTILGELLEKAKGAA